MKKLAYITLAAAFIFGVQPQEAFSTENNILEIEESVNEQVRIGYDERKETLLLVLESNGDTERALVQVEQNGKTYIKEALMVTGRSQTFEIDMSGLPGGAYTASVVAPSFKAVTRFKKK